MLKLAPRAAETELAGGLDFAGFFCEIGRPQRAMRRPRPVTNRKSFREFRAHEEYLTRVVHPDGKYNYGSRRTVGRCEGGFAEIDAQRYLAERK